MDTIRFEVDVNKSAWEVTGEGSSYEARRGDDGWLVTAISLDALLEEMRKVPTPEDAWEQAAAARTDVGR